MLRRDGAGAQVVKTTAHFRTFCQRAVTLRFQGAFTRVPGLSDAIHGPDGALATLLEAGRGRTRSARGGRRPGRGGLGLPGGRTMSDLFRTPDADSGGLRKRPAGLAVQPGHHGCPAGLSARPRCSPRRPRIWPASAGARWPCLWRSREKYDPGAFGQESQRPAILRLPWQPQRPGGDPLCGDPHQAGARGVLQAHGHGADLRGPRVTAARGWTRPRPPEFEHDHGFLFRQKYPFADLSQTRTSGSPRPAG